MLAVHTLPWHADALGKPFSFNHSSTQGLCWAPWKELLFPSRALSEVKQCKHSSNTQLFALLVSAG